MSVSRFYENEFPEPGESVVVKVLRLESTMGAYVSLLEYGRMEGLILPNELSKRRFRSIHKLIKVGRQEVVSVVRVDADKGYVDLSKKRVAPEDIVSTEQRFSNAKKVQLTVRQAAAKLDKSVDELNEKAIWPLYRKYGHAYEGFKIAADNPSLAFEGIDCAQEIIDAIVEDIRPRFAPQSVKARVRVHCVCTGVRGVEAVKEALMKAEAYFASSEEEVSVTESHIDPKELINTNAAPATKDRKAAFSLKVLLVASPLYTVVAQSSDKAYAVQQVQKALDIIRETLIATPGGEFKQQGEILVFGADDDNDPDDQNKTSSESSSDEESGSNSDGEEDEEVS